MNRNDSIVIRSPATIPEIRINGRKPYFAPRLTAASAKTIVVVKVKVQGFRIFTPINPRQIEMKNVLKLPARLSSKRVFVLSIIIIRSSGANLIDSQMIFKLTMNIKE